MRNQKLHIVVLTILGLVFSSLSLAQSKSGKKYHFSYSSEMFSRMNHKQRVVYFKAVRKVSLQMARGGVVQQNLNWDRLLFETLHAQSGDPFHNGFSIPGRNYDQFFGALNLGRYQPTCPAGTYPCAPYMGLVRNGNNVTVACANGTNACASAVGSGGLDILVAELARCQNQQYNRADCASLQTVLSSETAAAEAYCERRGGGACQTANNSAQAFRRDSGTQAGDRPGGTTLPARAATGQNCQPLQDYMRDRANPNWRGRQSNSFWQSVSDYAARACPGNVNIADQIGSCHIENFQQNGQYVYGGTGPQRGNVINELTATGTAGDRPLTASELEVTGVLPTIATNGTLASGSNFTEDHFKAALGMSIQEFRAAFCTECNPGSTNFSSPAERTTACHRQFANRLRSQLNSATGGLVRGSNQSLRNQAQAARIKMTRCAAELEAPRSEGRPACQFETIRDGSLPHLRLRDASPENPILAVNRRTGACSLVTGQSIDSGATVNGVASRSYTLSLGTGIGQDANGQPVLNTQVLRSYPSEAGRTSVNINQYAQDHDLQILRCGEDGQVPQVPGQGQRPQRSSN